MIRTAVPQMKRGRQLLRIFLDRLTVRKSLDAQRGATIRASLKFEYTEHALHFPSFASSRLATRAGSFLLLGGLALFVSCIATGCSGEEAATKVAAEFFQALKKERYDEAMSHFDTRIYGDVPRNEMREALEKKTSVGAFRKHNCTSQKASRKSVTLQCKTTYGPVHFTEKLSIVRGSKGWKIFSYRYDAEPVSK